MTVSPRTRPPPWAAVEWPASLDVRPIRPAFGVRVAGIDLSKTLSGAEVFALRALADRAGLLVVEGQTELSPRRLGEAAEWFGAPYLPEYGDDGVEQRRTEFVHSVPADGPTGWEEVFPHTDNQPRPVPPDFTLFHALEVPPPGEGGTTAYADLCQAYAELDEPTRRRIEGLEQHLHLQLWGNYHAFAKIRRRLESAGRFPPDDPPSEVRHPVVRTHPVDGRRALWVSVMTLRVAGIENAAEARQLTDHLKRHVCNDRFWLRHEWAAGDLVVWDNRCVLHRREGWNPRHPRRMNATQSGGSRPF